MERDTTVNYLDSESGKRIPRDVEVFNPDGFNSDFTEADDMNALTVPDVDTVDGNLDGDTNVNFANAERESSRTPRDVEVFDPELASELSRTEYSELSPSEDVGSNEWNNTGLENDLNVNERAEGARMPRDVELIDTSGL